MALPFSLLRQSQPKGPTIKQSSPDQSSWGAWRKLFRTISNRQGHLHATRHLGNWTVRGQDLRRLWLFLYSPRHDTLYRTQTDTHESLPRVRTGIYSFYPAETITTIPDDAAPVDCAVRSDGWYIQAKPRALEEIVTFAPDWQDYVSALDEWELMLLQRIDFKGLSPLELFS
jgi:hypothetical protein